jgi:maltose alpha-D-glucosyltransferase/alpha-amylase
VWRPPVLRLRYDHDGSTVITLVNLSDQAVEFQLCGVECVEVIDVVADGNFDAPHGDSPVLDLRPYGYHWLRPRRRMFRCHMVFATTVPQLSASG